MKPQPSVAGNIGVREQFPYPNGGLSFPDSSENRRKPLTREENVEEIPPTPAPALPERNNEHSLCVPTSPSLPCRLSRSGSASAALAARLSRKASGRFK